MIAREGDAVFFPDVVVLLSGTPVELPTYSLRREERVRRLMSLAFDTMPSEVQLTMAINFFSPAVLAQFFSRSPELWLNIGELLFGRSPEWVQKNVTFADILKLVLMYNASDKEAQSKSTQRNRWTFGRFLDWAAQEYGWTVDHVCDLSRNQLVELMKACTERYKEKERASKVKPGDAKPTADEGVGEDGGLSSIRSFAQTEGAWRPGTGAAPDKSIS